MLGKLTLGTVAPHRQSAKPLPKPNTPSFHPAEGFGETPLQPREPELPSQYTVERGLVTSASLAPSMRMPPLLWTGPVEVPVEPNHTFALMILEYSATDGRM